MTHPDPRPGRGDVTDRAAAILESAAELFAARGVDHTSMREIADRVGINVGGLYYYFRSKDLLLGTLLADFLTGLVDAYDDGAADIVDPLRRLRAIIAISFETAMAQPNVTKVYQTESRIRRAGPAFDRVRDLSAEAQRRWTDTIERGQRSGELRTDVPARVFHRFLRDAVWLSTYWHDAGTVYTAEQLTDHAIAVFVAGMGAPGAASR